jgi:hypothetical protein
VADCVGNFRVIANVNFVKGAKFKEVVVPSSAYDDAVGFCKAYCTARFTGCMAFFFRDSSEGTNLRLCGFYMDRASYSMGEKVHVDTWVGAVYERCGIPSATRAGTVKVHCDEGYRRVEEYNFVGGVSVAPLFLHGLSASVRAAYCQAQCDRLFGACAGFFEVDVQKGTISSVDSGICGFYSPTSADLARPAWNGDWGGALYQKCSASAVETQGAIVLSAVPLRAVPSTISVRRPSGMGTPAMINPEMHQRALGFLIAPSNIKAPRPSSAKTFRNVLMPWKFRAETAEAQCDEGYRMVEHTNFVQGTSFTEVVVPYATSSEPVAYCKAYCRAVPRKRCTAFFLTNLTRNGKLPKYVCGFYLDRASYEKGQRVWKNDWDGQLYERCLAFATVKATSERADSPACRENYRQHAQYNFVDGITFMRAVFFSAYRAADGAICKTTCNRLGEDCAGFFLQATAQEFVCGLFTEASAATSQFAWNGDSNGAVYQKCLEPGAVASLHARLIRHRRGEGSGGERQSPDKDDGGGQASGASSEASELLRLFLSERKERPGAALTLSSSDARFEGESLGATRSARPSKGPIGSATVDASATSPAVSSASTYAFSSCSKDGYRIFVDYNFVVGASFSVIFIDAFAGSPKSFLCQQLCTDFSSCAGFFFQRRAGSAACGLLARARPGRLLRNPNVEGIVAQKCTAFPEVPAGLPLPAAPVGTMSPEVEGMRSTPAVSKSRRAELLPHKARIPLSTLPRSRSSCVRGYHEMPEFNFFAGMPFREQTLPPSARFDPVMYCEAFCDASVACAGFFFHNHTIAGATSQTLSCGFIESDEMFVQGTLTWSDVYSGSVFVRCKGTGTASSPSLQPPRLAPQPVRSRRCIDGYVELPGINFVDGVRYAEVAVPSSSSSSIDYCKSFCDAVGCAGFFFRCCSGRPR